MHVITAGEKKNKCTLNAHRDTERQRSHNTLQSNRTIRPFMRPR